MILDWVYLRSFPRIVYSRINQPREMKPIGQKMEDGIIGALENLIAGKQRVICTTDGIVCPIDKQLALVKTDKIEAVPTKDLIKALAQKLGEINISRFAKPSTKSRVVINWPNCQQTIPLESVKESIRYVKAAIKFLESGEGIRFLTITEPSKANMGILVAGDHVFLCADQVYEFKRDKALFHMRRTRAELLLWSCENAK